MKNSVFCLVVSFAVVVINTSIYFLIQIVKTCRKFLKSKHFLSKITQINNYLANTFIQIIVYNFRILQNESIFRKCIQIVQTQSKIHLCQFQQNERMYSIQFADIKVFLHNQRINLKLLIKNRFQLTIYLKCNEQVLNDLVYCNDEEKNKLTKLSIKFGSPTTITFLYSQTFRTVFLNDNKYKESAIPQFCSVKQSSFVAGEAQQIDISDLCHTNCLFQAQNFFAYLVNEKSQFIVFQMQEQGINQNFKVPFYSRKLIAKNQLDEDLQKLKNLSKAKLILNQNNSLQQASLITQQKFYWYQNGGIQASQFNFANFDDQSLSKIIIQDQYFLIPDDSTGIQIYIYSKISSSNLYSLNPFLNITISQFFKIQEWQQIQDKINSQDNSDPNEGDPADGSAVFEFNFSIKSLQVKRIQPQTINIFTYEQFSESICVFSVDLLNKSAQLIQKVPTVGKIPYFQINNNFLYANQVTSKGIRDSFSLVEFQQITSQGSYIPRQNYSMTSNISKILVSETLSYSLQENIISIIRRQVPFKLISEEEIKQQISIQYSEGAEDFWNFPATFKQSQQNLIRKGSSSNDKIDELNQNIDDDSNDSSGSYFSPHISLQDNDSLLIPVDSILVKNQDSLSIIVIQERLSHLICQPEEENDLNKEYTFYVSLEVFNYKDNTGNIYLQEYQEGIDITIYRDIFQNSTVALVVGLSVGLTLSLIVVIIFCIYFYRMKNHYQLLLQDNSKDLSKEVASSSINTSSNNSSNESYPSTINMQSNQTEEQQNNQINIFNNNNNNNNYASNKNNNNIIYSNGNGNQQIQMQTLDNYDNDDNGNNVVYHAQHGDSNNNGNLCLNKNEFYVNGYQIQNTNQRYIIPNNTQMQDQPNQELTVIRNPEQDISQNFPSSELQNSSNSSSNNNNNNNNLENINVNNLSNNKSNDKIKDIQKMQNQIALNQEQIIEDEFNSNNSNKSEHVSFRNNSIEEHESQNNSISDKSSKGPCAQSQISKETIGLDLISFKSHTSDQLRQSQTIYNSTMQINNKPNDNSIEYKLQQNQQQISEKRD